MKIFIDSANLDEIRQAHAWGIIDGVTTNPSLIAKSGRDFHTVVSEICAVVQGPVSAECLETATKPMILEGRKLAAIHPNVVVKVPLTYEGLQAVQVLTQEGIKTNVTLCFSAAQGLLAAKSGATYISPFVGRLDDINQHGMQLVQDLVLIYRNYNFPTQVLTASVRDTQHVIDAAIAGSHAATIPYHTIRQLVHHPLTDAGLAKFLADWQSAANKA